MQRPLLLRTLHKGLRRLLLETLQAVAASDLADATEGSLAAGRVRRLTEQLAEHDALEDEVLLPALAASAPEMAADLRVEHAKLAGLGQELALLAQRLETAPDAHRAAIGRRLEDRLGRLAAAHLVHLVHEESEVLRVLGAHLGDEGLAGLQRRLIADRREGASDWVALALPAVHPTERRALVADLRGALSAVDFEAAVAGARSALGPEAWAEALEA